jgi:peroxiredoxin
MTIHSPGTAAPDLTLIDFDSNLRHLHDYRGKNIVLVLMRGIW